MLQVLGVFGLFVCTSMLAGYLPVRLLAASWPRTSRLALQPLLGAGLTALTLGWMHYFTALGPRLVLVGLLPAVAGAITLGYDIYRRRAPRLRSGGVWLALSIAATVLVLAPFYVLGSATSFGLYSNDAFWWTAADWRVQQYAFDVAEEQVTSPLARIALKLKRYGFNYLSVLVQSVTGLRSWQVVHLNGAFGLFLVVQAGWLLARRLSVWWPMALLLALAAATNHFSYRVFLDAVLAFQFGFAYFMAVIAIIAGRVPKSDVTRYGLILGILSASLGVFYADLIPVTGLTAAAVSTGMLVLGTFSRRHLAIAGIAAGVFLVTMLPLVLALPGYVRHVATNILPGAHYRFDDLRHTWMHLFGAMDLYQYMHGLPDNPVQYAGALATSALLLGALAYSSKSRRILWMVAPVLISYFALWRYLMSNGQEYTAHRVMVVGVPFAIALLLGCIRPLKRMRLPKKPPQSKKATERRTPPPNQPRQLLQRTWPLVATLAFAANLYPAYRMLRYLETNYIAVTPVERQIGDEWISKLVPAGAKVTIDLEEDLFLFYGHYMYLEALRGLGGDESRLVFPRTFYMFVTGTPVEQFDPASTQFVLRRKGIGRILGSFRTIASNERYELLVPVDPASLTLVWFRHGFYQLERAGGHEWRWLGDAGSVTAVSGKPQTLEMMALLEPNPAIGSTNLHVAMGGSVIKRVPLPPTQHLQLRLPLKPGPNEFVFDSTTPPARFGNDLRPITVRLIDPKLTLAPRQM